MAWQRVRQDVQKRLCKVGQQTWLQNGDKPIEGMVRWLQFLPPAQRIRVFAAADVSRETIDKLKLPVVLSYGDNSSNLATIYLPYLTIILILY